MIQVFALIALAVLLAYKFILVFIQPAPTAPEARGINPWLPFGLSAAVEFGKDPVRFLQRQNKLLGNVFRANLIALECFFVLGAKAQAIFFRAHNNVLNFDEAMEQLIGETGVIGNEKDEWPKLSNTMINKGFMKQERVEAYAKVAQEETRRALNDWANLKRFDLFNKSSELTLRIGMRCMVGDRFTDMHAERVIPLYQQFERDLANPLRKLLPAFLPIPCRTRARSTRDTIGKLISEEIKMREKEANEGKTFVRNDYLEFLLHSKEAGKRFAHIFPEHIVLLIMASHTNTTGTMAWTISNLVANPKDMAAASDEISTVIPKETLISTQQQKYVEIPPFSALPFLEGCLKETGRSYSLLFLFRKTSQDVLIENVVIPKGVLVACSPVVTQTDEKLYDSPESYNPRRWALQERAKSETESSEKDDGISFVQFGHGRHRCLGEKFALMILKSVWVLLLGAYRVEFADAFTPPSDATKGYTANAKHDVRVGVPDFLSTIGTPWPFNPVWMKIQRKN